MLVLNLAVLKMKKIIFLNYTRSLRISTNVFIIFALPEIFTHLLLLFYQCTFVPSFSFKLTKSNLCTHIFVNVHPSNGAWLTYKVPHI